MAGTETSCYLFPTHKLDAIYFLLLATLLELYPILQGKKKYVNLELKINYIRFVFKWKNLTAATMSKACSETHTLSQIHG